MTDNRSVSAHLLLVFACLAWGGSYAVGRFGLSEGSALWLTLWRWGLGAVLFVFYLVFKWDQHGSVIQANLPRLTLISALGVVVYPATLFMAVAQTTALNASLYLSATPVLIVLISSLVWKERVGPIGAAAVLFGLLGALVLVFRGSLNAFFAFEIASGDTWAIVSALAWAGYCVSLPLKPVDLNEVSFLAVLVVIGSVILSVLAVAIGGAVPMPDTPEVAWSMVYFAVFPSILAFLAWNWGTTNVGPSIAAPYNNLVPFFGGALGVLLLGETIENYHLWGGGFVVSGLILNSMRR